jgi:hypothetical protein
MEQTLEEFKTELQKKHHKGKFKITGSWGVRDAHKLLRKMKWPNIGRPIKEGEFYAVIRGVNKLLAENVAKGETVVFPSRMGKLELRKFPRGVSIVDGKLKNTYPVDWAETFKLWYSDHEEKKKKTLLRFEEKEIYNVRYCKWNANYNNRNFYQFVLNRFIKKALMQNIKQGKVDTLWSN